MNQHLRIGITGGIGVGKSTVCEIFKRLGVPVYNADERAKFLMQNDQELISAIKKEFGWDAYLRNNELNRPYLSKIVFHNPEKLQVLNGLVHPKVGEDYEQWTNQHKDKEYSVKEAALLFEAESYKKLHKVIVVTCPINTRIERIMKRDGSRKEDILKRINNQLTDKERLEKADYVIVNDGNRSIIEQTIDIHHKILELRDQDPIPLKT